MTPKLPSTVVALFDEHYPLGDPAREILWQHSAAVAGLSLEVGRRMADDPGEDSPRLDFIEEAAWLHDIGIRYTHAPGIGCHGAEPYLCHGVIGRGICEEAGLPEHGLVCERHVGTGLTATEVSATGFPMPIRDMLPISLEERIICYADQFFSKSSPEMLELAEVRRRVGRHGAAPLARFETLHNEFGPLTSGDPNESIKTAR